MKKGAYDVFNDDNYKEAQQFMETGIDNRIERGSQTVTYDSSGHSTMSSGLRSFSKANSVASNEYGNG